MMQTWTQFAPNTSRLQAAVASLAPGNRVIAPMRLARSLRTGGRGVIQAGVARYAQCTGIEGAPSLDPRLAAAIFGSSVRVLEGAAPLTHELNVAAQMLQRSTTLDEAAAGYQSMAAMVESDVCRIGARLYCGAGAQHREAFALGFVPRYPLSVNYAAVQVPSDGSVAVHTFPVDPEHTAGWVASIHHSLKEHVVYDAIVPITMGWLSRLGNVVLFGMGHVVGGALGWQRPVAGEPWFSAVAMRLRFSFPEEEWMPVSGMPQHTAVNRIDRPAELVEYAMLMPRISYALVRRAGRAVMYVHFDRDCLQRWCRTQSAQQTVLGCGDMRYVDGELRVNGEEVMLHSTQQLADAVRSQLRGAAAVRWTDEELS